MTIKAETINQYMVLQFIERNFLTQSIEVKLIDRDRVRVTDEFGEFIIFSYNEVDRKVIY